MTPAASGVAIWRTSWLPRSETFIRDQADSLERWRPLRMGREATRDPLVEPDVAPFTRSLRSRARWRVQGPRAHLQQYRTTMEAAGVGLVHAHFARDAIDAGPIVDATGLPFVVTCHGFDVTRHRPGDPATRLRRRSLHAMFERADRLIAVSTFIASQMELLGAPTEKITVHHIGIPIRDTGADPVRDRRGVLFVGRLVPKKGVLDLVRAYAGLPSALRSVHPLRIVGGGPLEDDATREAARLSVPVELLGWRSSTEVARLMAEHAVFCGPSQRARNGDSEGLGLVFLEAALQHLPVVSYRHGGVPEAVVHGDTGLLVDERDVPGLTAALEAVLVDEDHARRLGDRGHARVIEEFDIRMRTRDLEAIYDEVAGSPR